MAKLRSGAYPRLAVGSGNCSLVISPRPPDSAGVVQKRLYTDQYRVFFDDIQGNAPNTRAEYETGEHITAVYEPNRPLDVDRTLRGPGHAPVPVRCPELVTYTVWCASQQEDPANIWRRNELEAVVALCF